MLEDPAEGKASAAEGASRHVFTMKTPASNRPDFWGFPVVATPEKEVISVGSCSLVFQVPFYVDAFPICLPSSKMRYVNYYKF